MIKQCKLKYIKKIVPFLLLFSGIAEGQIVDIPDGNFKYMLLIANTTNGIAYSNGISHKIDSNDDLEIQVSEAIVIDSLDVNQGNSLNDISSIEGINEFVNLKKLDCGVNSITNLDFLNLPNLKKLNCSYNNLNNLNLSNLTNLEELRCESNQLTSINLTNLINLKSLYCNSNNLTSLDLSTVTQLNELYCSFNDFTLLNLLNLGQLKILNCTNNAIQNLNLTGNPNLTSLVCNNNIINSLTLNGTNSLFYLDCMFNQLSTINLSGLSGLWTLKCSNNPLTSLDLSMLINLLIFECNNSLLTTLDFSNNTSLLQLNCSGNLLESLFIKNSRNEIFASSNWTNSPNLQFICADENQVDAIQNVLNANGLTNVVCNTYCSFYPGGNYNTIIGTITYDTNNNGCDASDSTQSFIRMNINDGTNQGATFTNATGTYNFYTLTGNFTVNPSLENPSFFTITPASATIPFVNTNNNVATQNFCISANGVHPDLEIVVAPITPARPGFNATYRVAYKNKGNQTLSGTATLNYNDAVLDFVSATAAPTSQSTGVLNWNYTILLPFESRSYFVTLNVNTPTETPPVNIDDVLTFSSTITPVASDAFPLDNSFTLNQTVVGSFDPNEIRCLQGSFIPPSEIGNYLHYMVNFENTGNAAAENVVVKVDIDATKYDIATLQMLNTSHPSYTRINGNKVEFIFENINLSATSGNPPVGGHGNVLFKIRSKNTLVSGNTVAKQANIYFDYNAPIDTNMALTTFGTLNNTVVTFDESISVFPNPTNGNVNINSKFNIKSIELYDVQGRILETVIENSNESIMDVSTRQSGIYFLKITTDEGSKVEKIMKE